MYVKQQIYVLQVHFSVTNLHQIYGIGDKRASNSKAFRLLPMVKRNDQRNNK